MESETLQSDYHSTEQPHFDEEWTLLTAQPVVPLAEVVSRRNGRKTLKLAGLFAIALILGAVSALVAIRIERRQSVQPAESDSVVEQPPATPADTAVKPTPEPETARSITPAPESAPKAVAVVTEKPKGESRVENKPPAAATKTPATKKAKDSVSVDDPQARMVGEFHGGWEERRARRARRRERNEGGGRRGRDLRRIDEIFEGRRP